MGCIKCPSAIFWIIVSIVVSSGSGFHAHCVQGKQFLSTKQESCVDCTLCSDGEVVLRPCEIHRDTICGPISELLKAVQPVSSSQYGDTSTAHHHRRHHARHHHQQHQSQSEYRDTIVWKYGNEVSADHTTDIYENQEPVVTTGSVILNAPPPVPNQTEAESSADDLEWDWQAIAMSISIVVCILFFLIITLYSLHQAKQWRRLKDNFEADVEELSANLGLMAPMVAMLGEKGDIMEPRIGPFSNQNYLNSTCVYLEQLLNGDNGSVVVSGVRKDQNDGLFVSGREPENAVYSPAASGANSSNNHMQTSSTSTSKGNVYIEETTPNANSAVIAIKS